MGVNELLILGVDAADFDILESDDVSLPTFQQLLDEGVSAPLRSTDPPITGAAWPTMACGRDPNDIGMFDFRNFSSEERREYRPTTSRVDPFWSYLSHEGYSVGLSGYPLAPLDKPADGFVLSWPWYIPEDEAYLSPSDFFEGTDIEVTEFIRPTTKFEFDRVEADLEDKIRFDERVLQEFEFDVYFSYLDADSIIHMTDAAELQDIYSIYETIDDGIRRLLSFCSDGCTVMVVSDHGISEVYGRFDIVQFLIDRGYLTLEQTTSQQPLQRPTAQRLLSTLKSAAKSIGIAPALKALWFRDRERRKKAGLAFQLDFDDIDWDDTSVVKSGDWGQLYAIEDEDDVGEAFTDLRGMLEPMDYQVEVIRPEEVYHGEPHPDAPSAIVTIWKDGQLLVQTSTVEPSHEKRADFLTEFDVTNYNHGKTGVFIAAGPELKEGEQTTGFGLEDVSPTILHMLIGATPPNIHGAAQTDLYQPSSERRTQPETKFGSLQAELVGEQQRPGEDIAAVKEKLSDLGYFE